MKKQHGGARPGAGRPAKDRTPKDGEVQIQNAEHYLELVVTGQVVPDSLRIQAARSLLAYQRPKQRSHFPSLPPKQLAKKAARAEEQALEDEFQAKAKKIREKFAAARGAE